MKVKTFFLITVVLVTFESSFGQVEWAPIGAKWYINALQNNSSDPPLKDYFIMESRKDTVINSVSYRMIGTFPTRIENGVVLYLLNGNEGLLYDFNLRVGESQNFNLITCQGGVIDILYSVTKIDFVLVNGDSLKRFTCTPQNVQMTPNPYVYIENIGSERIPIEDQAGCFQFPEADLPWMRCYEYDTIHYTSDKLKYYGNYRCDHVAANSASKDIDSETYGITPNPFINQIYINGLTKDEEFKIHDLNGRLVKSGQTRMSQIDDLGDLSSGLYNLQINSTSRIRHSKIIKD
jgi:Secretion system C-terminal sorting domain